MFNNRDQWSKLQAPNSKHQIPDTKFQPGMKLANHNSPINDSRINELTIPELTNHPLTIKNYTEGSTPDIRYLLGLFPLWESC